MRLCACGADLSFRHETHVRCVACYVKVLHGMVAAGSPSFQETLDALPPLRSDLEDNLREEIRKIGLRNAAIRKSEKAAAKSAFIAAIKDERSVERYGAPAAFVSENKKWLAAYLDQKANASVRDIDFLMNFYEWISVWRDSGKLEYRGCSKGQYCMARHGDVGPYAVGNVSIKTCSENIIEGHVRRQALRSAAKSMHW